MRLNCYHTPGSDFTGWTTHHRVLLRFSFAPVCSKAGKVSVHVHRETKGQNIATSRYENANHFSNIIGYLFPDSLGPVRGQVGQNCNVFAVISVLTNRRPDLMTSPTAEQIFPLASTAEDLIETKMATADILKNSPSLFPEKW